MKTHHKIFLASLALLLVAISAHCQTKMTEGKIVYSEKILDSWRRGTNDTLIPVHMIVYFKDSMERIEEYPTRNGDTIITILDAINNKFIQLDNNNGKKKALVLNLKDLLKENEISKENDYKELNDTAIVFGYKCNRVIFTSTNLEGIIYMYYSKDINIHIFNPLLYMFDNFKGLPVEFDEKINSEHSIITITNIIDEKVSDRLFEIPKDYEIEILDLNK